MSIEDLGGSTFGGGEAEGVAGTGDAVVGPAAAMASPGIGVGNVDGGRDGFCPRRERDGSDEGLDFDVLLGGISGCVDFKRETFVLSAMLSVLEAATTLTASLIFYWEPELVSVIPFYSSSFVLLLLMCIWTTHNQSTGSRNPLRRRSPFGSVPRDTSRESGLWVVTTFRKTVWTIFSGPSTVKYIRPSTPTIGSKRPAESVDHDRDRVKRPRTDPQAMPMSSPSKDNEVDGVVIIEDDVDTLSL
ncbi:hypothetical protein BU17DRAFT_64390 [Hysterangium stoloniferum]|nr:hypothetical protein BU17DRAFT_64390 [Hysterangium stoloniferum]